MNSTDSHLLEIATHSDDTAHPLAKAFARALTSATTTALLAALGGCSTTQASLPTVDDTQRRPVNSAAALELLSCRAEAQALRLNLLDPAQGGARTAATCTGLSAPAAAPKSEASPKAGSRSSRAVFEFENGQTELVLDETTQRALRRTALNADVVLVHAAAKASADGSASEGLARTRAQAAARALVKAGIEAQKVRVSWSLIDAAQPLNPSTVKTTGVVEVEFVERSARVLFSKPADPDAPAKATQNPAPTADPVKPAVASLDRAGNASKAN
jgi:hypothetical protein